MTTLTEARRPLSGKVAIVTGGGRGIGRAEAICLARVGARVVVQDVDPPSGRMEGGGGIASLVAEQIQSEGGVAVPFVGDVTDSSSVRGLFEFTIATFGRIDIVVNNAGILRDRMLVNLSDEEWDEVVDVNLRGPFLVMREACRYWRQAAKEGQAGDGRIINTTSTSGLIGSVGQVNYGAAKAGVAAMTRSACLEMGRYGVCVNAIAPVARTRLTSRAYPPRDDADDESDRLSPMHVARLVVYLAGPSAGGISGQVFGVSGGLVELYEGWRVVEAVRSSHPLDGRELDARMAALFSVQPRSYQPAVVPGQASAEWPEGIG